MGGKLKFANLKLFFFIFFNFIFIFIFVKIYCMQMSTQMTFDINDVRKISPPSNECVCLVTLPHAEFRQLWVNCQINWEPGKRPDERLYFALQLHYCYNYRLNVCIFWIIGMISGNLCVWRFRQLVSILIARSLHNRELVMSTIIKLHHD